MKRIFTRFTRLIIVVFFPGILFAQGGDYNILLNTGKFVPAENRGEVSKASEVFTKSLYGNYYYVTIQFNSLPTSEQRLQMKTAGIELMDYLPNLAYTAVVKSLINPSIFRNFNIRSIFRLTESNKASPALLNASVPPHADRNGMAEVTVISYRMMNLNEILPSLSALGIVVIKDMPVFRSFTMQVPYDKLPGLVSLPFVQWVEYIDPPNTTENLPGRTLHRVNVLNDGVRNLKGDGIPIGIWDGGAVNSTHIDFLPTGRVTVMQPGGLTDHGTHCSGTITGKGLVNPIARGMAPNATLFGWDYNGDIPSEQSAGITNNNLLVSSHSYGSTGTPNCLISSTLLSYSTTSRATDLNMNNFPNHLHVHSSGNSQSVCAGIGGYYTITGSGKSAKNNLVVANITSTEGLSSSSSVGPVHDGRIKPEISAMGTSVFSTVLGTAGYGTMSGTSMATPGVAGTGALLHQRYFQLNGTNAASTLIKNVICNGARDLGNPGPDYKFGFGRINALAAVKILEQNTYALGTVSTGFTNDVVINVPAGTAQLKVMLTWNDPAAAANTSVALINNLDLTVVNGATTTLPWILDKDNPSNNAIQGVDNISNIEQVTINNPAAGSYTLKVTGTAVTTGPTQPYALTWIIDAPRIEVTYPNGGESFNPGTTEVITWDNAGVTGPQTVEYSIDNGSNWNVISSTVPAATTRLSWAVPAANTSTALIRISSGSLTDVSDANFKILGIPTGFAVVAGGGCNSGEISFSWNATANATHYDIYSLNNTTAEFSLAASNITTTSHTITGLTPGASMWFYIAAKNNTTNAVGPRSNAINGIVSAGGGGLGAIGNVTGQNLICGTPNGVPYSIAAVTGATGYTWTVPAGATIATGQGTTSITVNYPAGSTSGNVTVFATAGSCQTPVSSFSVTIAPAAGLATSGGDQSANICPGDLVPTLTATATVPGGHTLVWYTTATGGSTVASPTLNAVGTVTYYAAARNNTTNCESATRTPVVLTISQATAASISAAGPTTFCTGGSVQLTASPGTSYLWSNGETTQSITVTTAGSYTVTVTTGSCVNTSPATMVTVNTSPTASISAGGATTFCDGLNVVLTASAGSSWLWSNGATTQSITVTTSGNYTVTVSNGTCSAVSSATTVTVNPNPPAVVTAGSATTFCDGGSVVLTANPGQSYLWSNGATTQSITINGPVGTTNYTVAVTQPGGCVSNSPAAAVTVNPVPAATITAGGPLAFCQGNDVTLTASAGSSWLWSNGATTQTITVGATGNYSVTVTSAGCSATSAATAVAVSPNPVVTISAAPYTSLYPGLSTTLTANVNPPGSYTYTWFRNGIQVPGANTATLTNIDLSELGSYTVAVTNTTGLPCANTSPALVIKDSASTRLFIYPSPNNGSFAVSYYTTGTNVVNSLAIYDSKGARVFNRNYPITSPYQRMDVDMSRYPGGVYRVVLYDKSDKKLADGSVLIQH